MRLQRNAIIGEYHVVDFIGEGGMGQVYRAVHTRLDRTVAIKILSQTTGESILVQRFLNEARIQASLRHPGVAALYDFTEYHGRSVIIMEYVDGQTVQEITAHQGPWTAEKALPVLRSCAGTLAYVHAQGVVHRDLKSANIKVTPNNETKLLDFGIATAQMASRLTTAGFVIGTFQSLSPEQARGEQAKPASDIWAFGVLAYEMLTASLPFEAASQMELFSKIMKANFTPPTVLKPAIPSELERVIVRCLRKNPADRYPSAEALKQDLDHLASTIGAHTSRAWTIGRKALVGAAAFLLLLAGVFFLARLLGGSSSQTAAPVSSSQPAATNSSTPSGPAPAPGSNSSENASASGTAKQVTVDVPEGSAEVWQGGKLVGRTPFVITKSFGDSVDLLLRQPGFDDLPVQFDVDERSEYVYAMQRSEPQP